MREPDLRLAGGASTLAVALAVIEQSAPDVLLVDLGLPDGRGAELTRRAAVGQRVGGEPEQLERHTGLQTPVEEAP